MVVKNHQTYILICTVVFATRLQNLDGIFKLVPVYKNKHTFRARASTTRVLVLPKMINMNILKTLYSSTTRVLIFQYSYSYDQYSPQPCIPYKSSDDEI